MKKPTDPSVAVRKRAARKTASKGVQPPEAAPRASKNILSAGIKALTTAHGEAVARQSRVFESLLGLGPKPAATGAPAETPLSATTLDPFGFKKFEDVFDQRVARALQHLGVASNETIESLRAEVEALRATVARLEAQSRKR